MIAKILRVCRLYCRCKLEHSRERCAHLMKSLDLSSKDRVDIDRNAELVLKHFRELCVSLG